MASVTRLEDSLGIGSHWLSVRHHDIRYHVHLPQFFSSLRGGITDFDKRIQSNKSSSRVLVK